METLYQILGLLGAGFIVFILYRAIKSKPASFSRENLSNSFSTMGFLALFLIAFVAFLVLMLR